MMTFDQLPLKEQAKLKEAFLNNPDTKKLYQMADYFRRNHDYVKALETHKEIDNRWEYLKIEHCKDYDKVIEETVKLSDLNLPPDILQPLLENIITVFVCCDIIETAYNKSNDLIKKVNKGYSVDNFQDLVDLINNVRRKLEYLRTSTGYMDDLFWGEACDKHYEMIRSKARAILKKKNTERWGKNLERYISHGKS